MLKVVSVVSAALSCEFHKLVTVILFLNHITHIYHVLIRNFLFFRCVVFYPCLFLIQILLTHSISGIGNITYRSYFKFNSVASEGQISAC
jgi:hypothetical protein